MKSSFERTLKYSFLLLKYRARSRSEIVSCLGKKRFDQAVIDKVLAFLEENNYINDKEFASHFVSFFKQEGWGPKKIILKLQKLGIAEDLIEDTLKDKLGFRQRMKELIEEKTGQDKSLANQQKLFRFLLSRGFSYDDICQALGEYEYK
ncbi:MAG: regulatory protein RecX [Candidatus Omnitrophota bacterium]